MIMIHRSHYAATWEALVVENAIAFYGNLAASPSSRTDPDTETVVAQQDHEEVSQRIPWSKMHPHQRHSRSSASLTENGVITTRNM
jgi:hypothetical protein